MPSCTTAASLKSGDHARRLYARTLVWDDHSGFEPLPEADLDQLERWRTAGVDYLSVNVGYDVMSWQATIRTLADYRRRLAARPDHYRLVDTADDVPEAKRDGLLAITFDLEGMDALNGDVAMVGLYHRLGVRQMLFAYNRNNAAGGGCHDTDVGLTAFGRAVVDEMNRVGMVVDCSHSARRTTLEAMERSRSPVIFSHSNPSAVVPHGRNIDDEQIRACAAPGGVIGLNGIGLFIGDRDANVGAFFRCIDYVVQLVGPEHAGIGLDYPFPVNGVDLAGLLARHPEVWPASAGYAGPAFRNVEPEQLLELTARMVGAGYPDAAIRGILGENFLRVARAVWRSSPAL